MKAEDFDSTRKTRAVTPSAPLLLSLIISRALSGGVPLPRASAMSVKPSRCSPLVKKASHAQPSGPDIYGGQRSHVAHMKPATKHPRMAPTSGKKAILAASSSLLALTEGDMGIMVKN